MATQNDTAPSVEDFNAGRALAIDYLRALDKANVQLGEVAHLAYHAGAVRPYLRRLAAQPTLVDGFDAIVSNFAGMVLEGTVPDIASVGTITHAMVYGPDFERIG